MTGAGGLATTAGLTTTGCEVTTAGAAVTVGVINEVCPGAELPRTPLEHDQPSAMGSQSTRGAIQDAS